MTAHVVMYSSGIGSWYTAKRVAEQHGTDNLVLLFADVKGNNPDPHVGEDPDTYRFVEESAANIGGELVVVRDGRDIWQVFEDKRFLGNSRLASCSHELKQKPARRWLEDNTDPATTSVYVGIDWTEAHRLPAIVRAYQPWTAKAPLCDPPYVSKPDMIAALEAEGIAVPALYLAGFAHNNCGGGCVRAGQAQWAHLLKQNRDRYLAWETNEQRIRDYLGKDVAIIKARRNGQPTPVTLRAFREGIEAQTELFDPLDIGGCGCFVDYNTDEDQTA